MNRLKKAIAIVLTLTMVLSMSAFNAFAATMGTGASQMDPVRCETLADLPTEVTIPAGSTVWYMAPVGALEVLVKDATTAVCIVNMMGITVGYNDGGVASCVFNNAMEGDYVTFGLWNQNPRQATVATITAGAPEEGTLANPQAVEMNAMLGNAYLMNTTLEAGDSDGYWYSVTADKAGVFYVEASCNAEVNYGVTVEVNGNQFTLSEGNPVITYEVAKGDVILVNVYAGRDNTGAIPGATINAAGYLVQGTEADPVILKGSPVRVPVAAGKTVYVKDGSRAAAFCGTGLVVSGSADAIAKAEIVIGADTYTDTDGDGKIELAVSGDYYNRPVIAITNNYEKDRAFTLTVADAAVESALEPTTGHALTYVPAIEAGCHYKGHVEYWYCEECEMFYADAECTKVINYLSATVLPTGGTVEHVEAVTPGCYAEGNIEYWYCEKCEQVWADEALTQLTNIKNVKLPATCQNVTHIDAVAPTCHNDGNVEYWYCEDCGQAWTDEARMQLTNVKNVILPATGGILTDGDADKELIVHVEAVEPGCHFNGVQEHWYCTECETVWADEALTQITNHKNVVIPATGEGNVVHMEAVEPGCHFDGVQEHWYCTGCETVWADEALTQITNHKNVIIPATGEGKLVHVEAVDPTCHTNGNIEHWYCEECEQVWTDEALTKLSNHKNVIVPATDKLVHVEAVAPGCHYDGVQEHWYCTGCETVWSDEALTQITNHKNVIIPATGEGNVVHMEAVAPGCHYEGVQEHWYCTECEQVWADEALTQLTNHKNVIIPALGEDILTDGDADKELIVHVEAVDPTCHTNGNIEHWYCTECEQVWSDEALTQLTNHKNVIVPATSDLVHVEAVAPGCHFDGVQEHWYCTGCETVWSDEALTQITNHKNVIIPATGEGNVVHMEAVAPGCHYEGVQEHWYCTECEQVWADEALTQLTNHKNVIIPALGGELVHIEAVAPGCHFQGVQEHWYCTGCETVWADEALTKVTNHKNVIIPATGEGNVIHVEASAPGYAKDGNVEHWYCTECETVWADEALTQITNHKNVMIPALEAERVESSTSNDDYYTNAVVLPTDSDEYKNAVTVLDKVIKDKSFAILEINLFTVEGNNQMTVVDGYIHVTISVPADVEVGEGQKLVVYRIDGENYVKCDVVESKDGKLTFKTNHFSTYVVVAEDVVMDEVAPETGDSANFVLWFSVLALGVAAMLTSVVMRKREF